MRLLIIAMLPIGVVAALASPYDRINNPKSVFLANYPCLLHEANANAFSCNKTKSTDSYRVDRNHADQSVHVPYRALATTFEKRAPPSPPFPPKHPFLKVARNEKSWSPRAGESVPDFVKRCNEQLNVLVENGFLGQCGYATLTSAFTTYLQGGGADRGMLDEIQSLVRRYVWEHPVIHRQRETSEHQQGPDDYSAEAAINIMNRGGFIAYFQEGREVEVKYKTYNEAFGAICHRLAYMHPGDGLFVHPAQPTESNVSKIETLLALALEEQPCVVRMNYGERRWYVYILRDDYERRAIGLQNTLDHGSSSSNTHIVERMRHP